MATSEGKSTEVDRLRAPSACPLITVGLVSIHLAISRVTLVTLATQLLVVHSLGSVVALIATTLLLRAEHRRAPEFHNRIWCVWRRVGSGGAPRASVGQPGRSGRSHRRQNRQELETNKTTRERLPAILHIYICIYTIDSTSDRCHIYRQRHTLYPYRRL